MWKACSMSPQREGLLLPDPCSGRVLCHIQGDEFLEVSEVFDWDGRLSLRKGLLGTRYAETVSSDPLESCVPAHSSIAVTF